MTRTGDKFLTVKDWFADKVAKELSRKIDMCDVFAILKETVRNAQCRSLFKKNNVGSEVCSC